MKDEKNKQILDLVKKRRQKNLYKTQNKEIINFLHIGKTGGTAIKFALKDWIEKPINSKYVIYLHPHRVRLKDIPEGEKVFFFLRNPINRFISGFYSRQRRGQPRIYSPWTEEEKIAFENFKTPNDLAIALSSPHLETKRNARTAIQSIRHTRKVCETFFSNIKYFKSRLSDIMFIGFQETLAEDFYTFKSILSLPATVYLPNDPIKSHQNPPDLDTKLTEEAIFNLSNWYRDDFELIEFCRTIINENYFF